MKTFRTPLIAVAVLTMTPFATFSQVRIITPDSEHLYSTDPRTPGQQLPDDKALQLQNERAERARIARKREKQTKRPVQRARVRTPISPQRAGGSINRRRALGRVRIINRQRAGGLTASIGRACIFMIAGTPRGRRCKAAIVNLKQRFVPSCPSANIRQSSEGVPRNRDNARRAGQNPSRPLYLLHDAASFRCFKTRRPSQIAP